MSSRRGALHPPRPAARGVVLADQGDLPEDRFIGKLHH
jgi:hypothetical protein